MLFCLGKGVGYYLDQMHQQLLAQVSNFQGELLQLLAPGVLADTQATFIREYADPIKKGLKAEPWDMLLMQRGIDRSIYTPPAGCIAQTTPSVRCCRGFDDVGNCSGIGSDGAGRQHRFFP